VRIQAHHAEWFAACRLLLLQDRRTKKERKLTVIKHGVQCIDSVQGNGDTVRDLRSLLESTIKGLPTMRQRVPKKWVQLLKIIRTTLLPYPILPLESALQMLGLDTLEITKDQALGALQFWDDLGHLRLHNGSAVSCLVTNIQWLIEHLRPLLHHNIWDSLKKVCLGKEKPNECDLEVAGRKCQGLAGQELQRLLEMALELQELGIVRLNLLPYLRHWCDLQTEQEKLAVLEIFERCLLVTSYSIGGDSPASVERVITCRIKDTNLPQPGLQQVTKKGPVVCCRANFYIPPGLFSSLQALQISRLRKSVIHFAVQADSTSLQIFLNDKHAAIAAWIGQEQHSVEGQIQARHQLYMQADSLQLLTFLCCDFEGIVRDMFPGFTCKCSVLFHHLNAVYEWCVDTCPSERIDQKGPRTPARLKKTRGQLGYILCHGLNQRRYAELVLGLHSEEQPPTILWNVPLHRALHPLRLATAGAETPYFFVSYSSDDSPLALDTASRRVLGGVVDLVEVVSGKSVLVSSNLRCEADEAACRGAHAVIFLLCPAYLASRFSLLELETAREARLARGVPLLAVTVDDSVHACIMKEGANWAALRDSWQVAEATVELVRKLIENRTMLVCREWENGSGLPTQKAAESIAEFVNAASLAANA
jgi:hypothetical protein